MTRNTRRAARRGPPLLATLLVAAAACSPSVPAPTPAPAPGPAEAARHRAALATVTARNETGHVLTILFRPGTPPGGTVGIGAVAPGQTATMAPVPAGEPIVLIARRADRAVHELEPRSFEIDQAWEWVIPADAAFRMPEERP